MKNQTDFQAVTVRKCIIPDKRKVILRNSGAGLFLIIMAETNKGKIKSTNPFTLFIRREDFVPTQFRD